MGKRLAKLTMHDFAEDYAALETKILNAVVVLDDKGLADLEKRCLSLTGSNCWYAEYRVAPMVRHEIAIQQEMRARDKQAAEGDDA